MNCCYASNLYNKIKERLTGCIRFQKKYLHIKKEGNVLEWSFEPYTMDLDYNHGFNNWKYRIIKYLIRTI